MKAGLPDPAGQAAKQQLAEDLGIRVDDVRVVDVYTVNVEMSGDELERIRAELFTDPIIHDSAANASLTTDCDYVIEVGFRPGVTDNVGKSSTEAVADTLGRGFLGKIHERGTRTAAAAAAPGLVLYALHFR